MDAPTKPVFLYIKNTSTKDLKTMSSEPRDQTVLSLKEYNTLCHQCFDPKHDLLVTDFIMDSN